MSVLPGGMKMLGEEGALPCWDSLVVAVLDHPQRADGSKAAVMCPDGFAGHGSKGSCPRMELRTPGIGAMPAQRASCCFRKRLGKD